LIIGSVPQYGFPDILENNPNKDTTEKSQQEIDCIKQKLNFDTGINK
jgi:hypothetical protein